MKYIFPIILLSISCHAEEVRFSTKEIILESHKLTVEIADSEETQRQGLMNRTQLDQGRGMLFIVENPRKLSFWMKNTFIPLSIAFFDKDRKLVDIKKMKPVASILVKRHPAYTSSGVAKYALEVNQGWFENNKIKIGSQFQFVSKKTRPSSR